MNTFIVGCQRCATTYLTKLLDQHPDIHMAKPIRPEPKFFLSARECQKGRTYYQRRFFASRKESVLGEKSTSYIEYAEVAERIRCFFPDARIIIVLRNPVERAISHYFFSVRNGLESRNIEDALFDPPPAGQAFETSVSPFCYVERSKYLEPVNNYLSRFDNVRVLITEQTVGNLAAIQEVYRYLDVDPAFVPNEYAGKVDARDSRLAASDVVRDRLAACLGTQIVELENLLGKDLGVWNL